MENKELVVNEQTIQARGTSLDKYVQGLTRNSGVPAHLALIATRHDLNSTQKLEMLTSYTSAPPLALSDMCGKALKIVGATIYEQGAFNGRDGEESEGYTCFLLKTDLQEIQEITAGKKIIDVSRNIVIKSSSGYVNDFFLGLISLKEPFDFEEPITVFFTGSRNNGIRCQVLPEELVDTIEAMAANS